MSISDKWKDGQMPGTFDGFRKQALMRRADSTDSPGQDLPTLGDEMTEELSIFKVDIGNFFRAEFADSLAPNTEPSRTWHSSSPFYIWGPGIAGRFPDEHSLQIGWGSLVRFRTDEGVGHVGNIGSRFAPFLLPGCLDLFGPFDVFVNPD
jgi:hypothetical protein